MTIFPNEIRVKLSENRYLTLKRTPSMKNIALKDEEWVKNALRDENGLNVENASKVGNNVWKVEKIEFYKSE